MKIAICINWLLTWISLFLAWPIFASIVRILLENLGCHFDSLQLAIFIYAPSIVFARCFETHSIWPTLLEFSCANGRVCVCMAVAVVLFATFRFIFALSRCRWNFQQFHDQLDVFGEISTLILSSIIYVCVFTLEGNPSREWSMQQQQQTSAAKKKKTTIL